MKFNPLEGPTDEKYLFAYAPRFAGSPSLRYVDPATIAAVVQAAMETLEKRKFADWQDSVSGQLAAISAKLDEIVRMIQELRDHIDEQLRKTIVDLLGAKIRSGSMQIDEYLHGIGARALDTEERKALVALTVPLRTEVGALMEWEKYGFDGHYGAIAGCLTLLNAYHRAEVPEGQRTAFIRNIIKEYLQPAQDPNNPRSLEADRNQSAILALEAWNRLNSLLNRWWLFNAGTVLGPRVLALSDREPRDPPEPRERIRVGILGMVTGNPDAGFAYHQQRGSEPLPAWFPNIPEPYDMGDGFAKSSHWIDVYCIQPLSHQIKNFTAKEAGLATIVGNIRQIIARLENSPALRLKASAADAQPDEKGSRGSTDNATQTDSNRKVVATRK